MHEVKIASDLAEIVLGAAGQEKLSKVNMVNVVFGQLVQIVPELFVTAFSSAVDNTIACDAELNIEIVPVKLRCRHCGSDFSLRDNLFSCDSCGSDDIDIVNGTELFVKTIEGE